MQPIFMFDGSFTGFLTAAHLGLSESYSSIKFNGPEHSDTLQLFGQNSKIKTDNAKARMIWRDLGLKGTEIQKRVYYSFLHKNKGLQPEIYQYIAKLLYPDMVQNRMRAETKGFNLAIPTGEVSKEKREVEQQLQFKCTADGLWYSEISSQHHVLPLLSMFCRTRFHSDPWLIADIRRGISLSSLSGTLVLAPYKAVNNRKDQWNANKHNIVNRPHATLEKINHISEKQEVSNSGKKAYQGAFRNEKWPEEWKQQAV